MCIHDTCLCDLRYFTCETKLATSWKILGVFFRLVQTSLGFTAGLTTAFEIIRLIISILKFMGLHLVSKHAQYSQIHLRTVIVSLWSIVFLRLDSVTGSAYLAHLMNVVSHTVSILLRRMNLSRFLRQRKLQFVKGTWMNPLFSSVTVLEQKVS